MPQTYNKQTLGNMWKLFNPNSELSNTIKSLSKDNYTGELFDICHHSDRTKDFLRNHLYYFFNADDELHAKGFDPKGELCMEGCKIQPNKNYSVSKNLVIIESGSFGGRYYLIANTFDQTTESIDRKDSI